MARFGDCMACSGQWKSESIRLSMDTVQWGLSGILKQDQPEKRSPGATDKETAEEEKKDESPILPLIARIIGGVTHTAHMTT